MPEFTFKFATISAVSTDEQIDKSSIPSQIEVTRQAGERLGGVFVASYVIDGYSRTNYWELSQARKDIPPLDQCLRDLDKYDVLIVKNYDRFGSLSMMIYNYFSSHKKQLYSVQQGTTLYDPATYVPGIDISVPMLMQTAGISQVYRIAKISDAFRTGNPKRAKEGKHGNVLPYGYLQPTKDHIIVDERVASLLRKFPEWFLSGEYILERRLSL